MSGALTALLLLRGTVTAAVHTTRQLHRCKLLGRHPECCKLQLCSLLPRGLVGHICSTVACCVSFSFAGCLSLSFSFCLRIVVGSFVMDCLSNRALSFALSCVSVALLSVAFSFVAFVSFTFSFLSFAFAFALSCSFVDGSCVHRCSSSVEVCCNTG